MSVEELINRLREFDPKMEVKILPKGTLKPTEVIGQVGESAFPCPRICVLIEGT